MHTIVEQSFQMRNVVSIARESIDTLDIKPEKFNALDTLVHNHGDGSPISLEQIF